ncbi:uncharacterized protein LOC126570382 [Anopheles aquasalis]|uniref:uncharacterized protein LOC126570382 n=1 Tax=Anopheles aquasalis TaxID=42839 RepID=UPI00215AFA2B|nr:uncharacterized protein LOC126570382 [Anopheles aquasalis]
MMGLSDTHKSKPTTHAELTQHHPDTLDGASSTVRERRRGKPKATIRKLAARSEDPGRKLSFPYCRLLASIITLCVASGSVALLLCSPALRQELVDNYHEAFDRLTSESSKLCSDRQATDFGAMSTVLGEALVGQTEAHRAIRRWFQQKHTDPCRFLVLQGSTGTGKSLAASVIVHQYPWPEKVFHVMWREQSSADAQYAAFQSTLAEMRQQVFWHGICGDYLLVVDHLGAGDVKLLVDVSEQLRTAAERLRIKLNVLLAFRGSPVNQPDTSQSIEQVIPNVEIVRFSALGSDQLNDCIRREGMRLGFAGQQLEEAVATVAKQIDVVRYGCKPVRAKLNLALPSLAGAIA